MATTNRPDDKPAAEKPSAGFALFFSSVEGHLVPRYGAGSPAPYIGASSVADPRPGKPGGTKWDTAQIVALTEAEARLYRKEYADAVAEGALRVRRPEEFDRAVEAEQREAAQAAERAAKAKAKAEEEEAKAKAKAELDAKRAAPGADA